MPANTASLQASIDALTAEAEALTTTKDGVLAYINGFAAMAAKAVTDALTADNAADDATVAAAAAAIEGVRQSFATTRTDLGAAIVVNTPSA